MKKIQQGRFKRISILVLVLFTVPIIGWLTSLYVESSYDTKFRKVVVESGVSDAEYDERKLSYLKACGKDGLLRNSPNASKNCSFADEIENARLASLSTAILGVALLLLIYGAKSAAGSHRGRLSLIFNPTVRVVMLLLSISLFVQGGLFIYSIYTIEVALTNRVHVIVLGLIGLGALYGSVLLMQHAFGFFKLNPLSLRARLLQRQENADVYSLVDQLAAKLRAEPPNNIVVGLEPNFFVTSGTVTLVGQNSSSLEGRTLYLSLALMRILSREELAAIIGHELGHFRGQDTEYSLKFAPIYSNLSNALNGLTDSDGSSYLATLPAVATLGVCLTEFAEAERTVGRERELLADRAGAEAASAESLATALVKVSLYSQTWGALTQAHINLLAKGNFYQNLAAAYGSVCQSQFAQIDWPVAKSSLLQFVQPHPIDTHPPLRQRFELLGASIEEIGVETAKPAQDPAISLVKNVGDIEDWLTALEIRWLEAIGAVVLPPVAHGPHVPPLRGRKASPRSWY